MTVYTRRKIYGSVFSASLAVGLLMLILPFALYAVIDGGLAADVGVTVIYALALLIPAMVGFSRNRNDMPLPERKRLVYPPAAVFIALGTITLSAYLNYFIIAPFSAAGILVNVENTVVIEGMPDVIMLVFRSALVAPICEEIFFRGFVLRRLSPLGARRAILVSALVFAMFHTNVAQFIYAFAAGVVLGAITFVTGRVRYAIIIHVINNGISVGAMILSRYYGAEAAGTAYSRVDVLLILAAVASVIFILIRRMKDPSVYSLPKGEEPPSDGLFAVSVSAIIYTVFTVALTAVTNLSIFYR